MSAPTPASSAPQPPSIQPPACHTVLHDPHGLIEADLPLDRAPHEALVTVVLAWTNPALAPRDYEQIALQLTGHARAVAADIRRHTATLPKGDGRGALAEVVLREADNRLSAPIRGTARCAQNRARLVQALYTRLDRLEIEPAPEKVVPNGG
ncbi:restriction endonuclease [Streptomyces sp. NPDC002225]|uniref:restriction endonuclease n=1 Tax=Streptomyces sp. NPDC002225 TaxID=3154413 RepID=UPI00332A22F4